MFKVSFFKIISYLLLKYTIFFFILSFFENRFQNAVINNAKTSVEFVKLSFGYMLYVFFHMIILILLFSVPLYFVLTIRNRVFIILMIVVLFFMEYLIYSYLFSPSNYVNGIYNAIVGIVVFVLFFYKQIKFLFK